MDPNYHARQLTSPAGYNVFSGPLRQRGSGIGALAIGAVRYVAPLILPLAAKIGKQFVSHVAPELADVVTGKTKAKSALKRAATKTILTQFGGGRRRS